MSFAHVPAKEKDKNLMIIAPNAFLWAIVLNLRGIDYTILLQKKLIISRNVIFDEQDAWKWTE